jgi:hypothetical protein
MAFIALTLVILSCERETDWTLNSGDDFVIADCIITNEMKPHELRLYRSTDQPNQQPEGISGMTVQLDDGSNTVFFTEDGEEPGRYLSEVSFAATVGITYRLILSYNGQADTAFAVMTGVSPLEPPNIEASDGFFHLVYQPGTPPSMTEVYYDWSADGVYCEQYGACQAVEIFYSLDNIDIGKEFAPEKQVILFPYHTRIIRRKYSLSEDHQQFIRSLLLETEWRGGLFDVEQGNVPTNFRHGVRGWFGACAVVSDTTYFD